MSYPSLIACGHCYLGTLSMNIFIGVACGLAFFAARLWLKHKGKKGGKP